MKCPHCGSWIRPGKMCGSAECRQRFRHLPLERPAANGHYAGNARVRVIAPGVSGDEDRREKFAKIARARNVKRAKYGPTMRKRIMRLVGQGLSYPEIGRKLHISISTAGRIAKESA